MALVGSGSGSDLLSMVLDPLARKAALVARVEEFYNTCHEDGTGRFCEIHGGIHEPGGEVRPASGTELLMERNRKKRRKAAVV